jgi:hypothetical protein
MSAEKQRNSNGQFLKSTPNMADTGSVVNQVKGTVSFGRLKVSGNDPKRNPMVSGNTGLKKR